MLGLVLKRAPFPVLDRDLVVHPANKGEKRRPVTSGDLAPHCVEFTGDGFQMAMCIAIANSVPLALM